MALQLLDQKKVSSGPAYFLFDCRQIAKLLRVPGDVSKKELGHIVRILKELLGEILELLLCFLVEMRCCRADQGIA